MKDTLDEIFRRSESKTFSRLAFTAAVISASCMMYLISLRSGTIKATEGVATPSVFLINSLVVNCLFGVLMTGISLVNKEPNTWIKWIGVIINVIIFLFISGSMVWYHFMETGMN